MTRRPLAIACGGATLWGTLDSAAVIGATGLLIVSGGREIRAGAHGGMARLAHWLADRRGVPVLRYDRRGVGDSEGRPARWPDQREDIAAALAAFRAQVPAMRRVVALGLCDSAAALMLHGADLGIDALVLINPWTFAEDDAAGHSASALRRRYLARLASPAALWRLLTGGVNLARLAGGLKTAIGTDKPDEGPIQALRQGLARFSGEGSILLSAEDRTGQRFADLWGPDPRIQMHPGRSHALTDDTKAFAWLCERLAEATASRH